MKELVLSKITTSPGPVCEQRPAGNLLQFTPPIITKGIAMTRPTILKSKIFGPASRYSLVEFRTSSGKIVYIVYDVEFDNTGTPKQIGTGPTAAAALKAARL